MLALLALLLAVAAAQGAEPTSMAWLAPLSCLAAAFWALRDPAWRQRTLALRASVLVGVFLALCAGQPAFGPVELTAIGYLALLHGPWALGLVAFAAGTRFLLFALSGADPADLVDTAVVALPVAALAGGLGAFLRRRSGESHAARFDGASGLCTREGLLAHAVELPRPVEGTLAVVDCADLVDARRLYGTGVGRRLLRQVVRRLEVLAGEDGIAARTGAAEFSVLLPGATREEALARVRQAFGSPSRIEYEVRGNEIMLVPDVALGLLGPGADLARLQDLLSQRLAQARDYETRRRRHLRRERERHSRPDAFADERGEVRVPTLPMPLRPA